MVANKEEVKIYFQTHNAEPKEVAKLYNVKYRTLMHWIKSEGWVKGSAIKNLPIKEIEAKLVQREVVSALEINAKHTKEAIKKNIGEVENISALVLNNILDSSVEELLLQTMSANFIQKNIALSAIIAKDELMKMTRLRNDNKADPMLIACAEKVNKIFIDMQNALYGKEIPKQSAENAVESLSTQELLKMLED